MSCQVTLFPDKDVDTIIELVKTAQHPTVPPSTPDAFLRLINGCWSKDPTQRPAFHDIENYLAQNDSVLLPNTLVFPLSTTPQVQVPSPTPSPNVSPVKPVYRPEPTPAPAGVRPPTFFEQNVPDDVVEPTRPSSRPKIDAPTDRKSVVAKSSAAQQNGGGAARRSSVVFDPLPPITTPQEPTLKVETGLPIAHKSYMNDAEFQKLQAILTKITEMLTSNVPALQLKVKKT